MKIQAVLNRLDKLIRTFQSVRLTRALLQYRVLVGAEHRHVLSRNLETVVDIGANRGQFSLAVRFWLPKASVISFEPLPGPAAVFRKLFSGDYRVFLHQVAIGPRLEQRTMHISGRDDSSSLLPISPVQTLMFPGTDEVATTKVGVGPLEEFVNREDLKSPAMLKLDVQGFEYEALIGCESMLMYFNWIYCECPFAELYSGQKLAWELIEWLSGKGFRLVGIFNPVYDMKSQPIQADFLFQRILSK